MINFLKNKMTIIEKWFDKKPTDKELYSFIAELIISNKGGYKAEVIYDKNNFLINCISKC